MTIILLAGVFNLGYKIVFKFSRSQKKLIAGFIKVYEICGIKF